MDLANYALGIQVKLIKDSFFDKINAWKQKYSYSSIYSSERLQRKN